jgi:bifunctional UDP-N-acetylglucosamine pyrophosphorylase / glucosamine-1-phosphate N-acetyltransferase
MSKLAIIILAAGQSSRMKSDTSKVLHDLAGWSVLRHVIETAKQLNPHSMTLVTSPNAETIIAEGKTCYPAMRHVVQQEARGTGDAVKAALADMKDFDGSLLVLYGDSPLTRLHTLQHLLEQAATCDVALTAMHPKNPAQYGRILCDDSGNVQAIIEYKDASEVQRSISLCNAGLMAINANIAHELVNAIDNKNAKGEYYLTDIVSIANRKGKKCSYILADEKEMLGINTRTELAEAYQIIQARLRKKALDAGVGLVAPDTVMLSMDTAFGYDVMVHPHVVFSHGVSVGDYSTIKSFSHLEGAKIGARVNVGPYARLRKGAELREGSAVGNFVEVKNAVFHEGAKAGHLSYLGDADIGANTNIGAGSITCNYDGKNKFKTVIGNNVFIGSDTAMVAPVRIGDNSLIAAGSVITDDVPDNNVAFARSRQSNKTKK